jgi:hypothetical protein
LIDIEVKTNVHVFPGVELSWVVGEGQLVSLQERALRNAGVLDLGLENGNSVVIQKVVDFALSGSEVFIGVLNNRFDEKAFENELLKYSN